MKRTAKYHIQIIYMNVNLQIQCTNMYLKEQYLILAERESDKFFFSANANKLEGYPFKSIKNANLVWQKKKILQENSLTPLLVQRVH